MKRKNGRAVLYFFLDIGILPTWYEFTTIGLIEKGIPAGVKPATFGLESDALKATPNPNFGIPRQGNCLSKGTAWGPLHLSLRDRTLQRAYTESGVCAIVFWNQEGAMSPKELKKFKEAAEKLQRQLDTPEKRKAILVKIGYLNPDGQVAERYR